MPDSPSPARSGIFAAGNWIIDHVKIIDRWPEQDALASILEESAGTGGAPYNVLLDLAKLGAPFPLAAGGLVGRDADGRAILEDCAAHGIDTTQLRVTDEAATSYTDVMTVQDSRRRTFFHCRGANARFDPSHLDLDASSARILHFGYLLLLDAFDVLTPDGATVASRMLAEARARGFRTSVDVVSEDSDRFAALVTPALPHVDILSLNEFEAGRTTGIDIAPDGAVDWDQADAATRRLLELGVHEWVVIHVPEGAIARHADGRHALHPALRLPPDFIRGTAGAGDAFTAGLLLGLHDDLPVDDCLRLGVCAAAASLQHPTCTAGLQSRDTCLALADHFGFRDLP